MLELITTLLTLAAAIGLWLVLMMVRDAGYTWTIPIATVAMFVVAWAYSTKDERQTFVDDLRRLIYWWRR